MYIYSTCAKPIGVYIKLKIIIKASSELPIYAQIEEQIKAQILSGEIPEGTVLPSIRKLASELKVSVITTTRAFSDLEANGFVAAVQGKGTVVLPQDNTLLHEQYLKRIEELFTEAISAARTARISDDEMKEILDLLLQDNAEK